MSAREVDAFRFTGRYIKKVVTEAIDATQPPSTIPWAAANKALSESKVALLTTAGISMKDDKPFDMQGERDKPTWGDPSWRRIANDASSADVDVNHLHIDTTYIERDINVALPVARLNELAADNTIGGVASHHYSIMGFQGYDHSTLEDVSGPEIGAAIASDDVDLVILAPV
ncbi:MAG: glycine/sarcosine/betaine reductase selenoprotein B family protein [Pseudomonadota bacterium]